VNVCRLPHPPSRKQNSVSSPIPQPGVCCDELN
jgi:hypothetical protein